MKLPLWVSLAVGALGAASVYLVGADPHDALLWQMIAGGSALLVPVAHKALS